MAHVHRLFRYRLSLISTLQHCRDQALSTVASEETEVTALAYLQQGTCCSKFVQQSIYFFIWNEIEVFGNMILDLLPQCL
jgi:hypothetical protein